MGSALMTLGELINVAVGLVAIAGPCITYGMQRQKMKDLEEDIKPLATKDSVKALEAAIGNLASVESVSSLGGRVHTLETDMREAREAIVAIPKLDEKIQGMKDLVTSQLDELKYGLREVRTFLGSGPAPQPRRRGGATD